jgi:UDP-N-acetylmuramate dehydrogenase
MIRENISLAAYTTFKLGGTARYFTDVSNLEELYEALNFAKKNDVSHFVLGGGSNVLIGDAGFPGLVIKMNMKGATFEERDGFAFVTVWAGEGWDELVAKTVGWNVWGLENLSLIPGTTGASPVQNIGAYGVEVKDVIDSVRALDAKTGVEKVFSNKDCLFAYRDSIFKRSDFKKYIILSVTFRLSLKPVPNLLYKDIKDYFSQKNITNPSQMEIRDAIIAIRTGKFPDLSKIGTAGSFWKNPIISTEHFEKIKTVYPLIPSFVAGEGKVKVPLAWILDNVCGLKGFAQGPVGLFEKQPLVLVARAGASTHDVDALAQYVAKLVREKTEILIEREVEGV